MNIDDSCSIQFLKEHRVAEKVSTMLIYYFGGRLVYMMNSITMYNAYIEFVLRDNAVIFEEIISDLFPGNWKLNIKHIIIENKPLIKFIYTTDTSLLPAWRVIRYVVVLLILLPFHHHQYHSS